MMSQGVNTPLQQVSLQELLDIKQVDNGSGSPYCYATSGFDTIYFYPNPASGEVVSIYYVDDVPELVEADAVAGQEETPTAIPAAFHWSVLLPATVLQMLDKDQRLAESQLWEERYARGLAKLIEHVGQFGGEANRAYVKKGMRRFKFNDQRSRW
jgi:hypothetical protein